MDCERMALITKLRIYDTKLAKVEKDLKDTSVYIAVTSDCVNEAKLQHDTLKSELSVYLRKTLYM